MGDFFFQGVNFAYKVFLNIKEEIDLEKLLHEMQNSQLFKTYKLESRKEKEEIRLLAAYRRAERNLRGWMVDALKDKTRDLILIFKPGKAVINYSDDFSTVYKLAEELQNLIKKIGGTVLEKPKVELSGLTGAGEIGHSLNLEGLSKYLEPSFMQKEGLVTTLDYKPEDLAVKLRLLTTGKFILSTKSKDDVQIALEKLKNALEYHDLFY